MAVEAFNAARFDLGSWTTNWTSVNVTQYVPSARDLALAGPRMFMKLGSFLAVPEAMDNIFGVRMGQRIIPEATGSTTASALTTTVAARAAREAIHATERLVNAEEEAATGGTSRFSIESARSLNSLVSYTTSKWALTCILMAIILNRTHIYASTRRNLNLPFKLRLAIRIVPMILLSVQALRLLQSIRCQTSPEFSMLRWGNASKSSDLMFTQNGGLLHTISSTMLLRSTDEDACLAVKMVPPPYDDKIVEVSPTKAMPPTALSGSLSLLWPLFKTFSFSQFVETISCAVQGRQVSAETGMTLFEHSLAFAEADATVGAQLGWGSFGGAKSGSTGSNATSTTDATRIAITRSMIMKRVNTTPEVLLVGFLSAMNHLTSHSLAVCNLQGRLRLVSTGFWGLTFISVIVWSISNFSVDDLSDQSLFRYPTVVMVGFIPHVLVLCGIIVCSIIYGAALTLSALAPPHPTDGIPLDASGLEPAGQRSTFCRRLIVAHHNMQANIPLSSIRINMHMDFYTALLRTGFSVMTMASEAVYLNESRGVSIKQRTWLEEDRLQEIEAAGQQWLGPSFRPDDQDSGFANGLVDAGGLTPNAESANLYQKTSSGYAKEMTAKKATKSKSHDRALRDGVGATERSGRWVMAFEFFLGISRLLLSWWASLCLRFLAKIGVRRQPSLLLWLGSRSKPDLTDSTPRGGDPEPLNFWLLNPDGELLLPNDEHADVELEMRNRLRSNRGHWDEAEERNLDANLYGWWLSGGRWGNDDSSGDYVPIRSEADEDTTSVVSVSASDDERSWATDYDDSDDEDDDAGRRTPTQQSPGISRESTTFGDTPLNATHLAQLLNPRTPDQRNEAQTLAAHLESRSILTRSRFRTFTRREKARVLTSTHQRPPNFNPSSASGQLTAEEEVQILEYLIITRRASNSTGLSASQSTSWAKGASGMGEGGPQCVVCQSSPRSIIVWPCRCLSLCDDCRVTLAMNNFDKCVCCRRDVASFSRIFVP